MYFSLGYTSNIYSRSITVLRYGAAREVTSQVPVRAVAEELKVELVQPEQPELLRAGQLRKVPLGPAPPVRHRVHPEAGDLLRGDEALEALLLDDEPEVVVQRLHLAQDGVVHVAVAAPEERTKEILLKKLKT